LPALDWKEDKNGCIISSCFIKNIISIKGVKIIMIKEDYLHPAGFKRGDSQERVEHVNWSDSYSTGINMIDEQHKGLLDLVNELFNHVTGNKAEEHAYFQEVIQQAVNYVKFHFATEEKYMTTISFPGFAEHKKVHEQFVLTVIKTIKDFNEGNKLTLENFANFLKDWVLSHIAVMDMQYANFDRSLKSNK
jgi:hemerythrin